MHLCAAAAGAAVSHWLCFRGHIPALSQLADVWASWQVQLTAAGCLLCTQLIGHTELPQLCVFTSGPTQSSWPGSGAAQPAASFRGGLGLARRSG